MEFQIGDKVEYKNGGYEIIEHIDERGWIKGKYFKSGTLSCQYAHPDRYKLIERKKIMKYDSETIVAIKESIEHHEENLRLLRTLEGKFFDCKLYSHFQIGLRKIHYNDKVCALCSKFREENIFTPLCGKCPLKLEGFKCEGDDNSPWVKINKSTTRSEAISAEENMVKVLRGLLPEIRFKEGDTVKCLDKDVYQCVEVGKTYIVGEVDKRGMFGIPLVNQRSPYYKPKHFELVTAEFKVGDRVEYEGIKTHIIKGCEFHSNGWILSVDGQCRRENKLTKLGDPMNKYDELKDRISRVTGWDKKADDILQEISYPTGIEGVWHSINIFTQHNVNFSGYQEVQILRTGKTKVISFKYTSQAEKLQAFKKALMYLLDHSDIKKEEEKTYKPGDRFTVDGGKNILSQVEPDKCCLISLKNGNRQLNSVTVQNSLKVTKAELISMGASDPIVQIT